MLINWRTAAPVQPGAPGYNLYAYSGNNPTTWGDPSGRSIAVEYGELLIVAVVVSAYAVLLSQQLAEAGPEIDALFDEIIDFNFPDRRPDTKPDDDDKPRPRPDPRPPWPGGDNDDPDPECPVTREEYYAAVVRTPQNSAEDWADYERRVVGPFSPQALLLGVTSAAGVAINADGLSQVTDTAFDAKFVRNPSNTIFSLDKPAFLTLTIRDEFARYGQVLRDPCVPVSSLSVRVSDAVAVPFLDTMMAENAVPGTVSVVP